METVGFIAAHVCIKDIFGERGGPNCRDQA